MNNPWEEIERPVSDLFYRLIDAEHPLRLLRARDSYDRFLFIYEFQGSGKAVEKIPELNGIDINLHQPKGLQAENHKMILVLRDKRDWQIFLSLCNDIVSSTRSSAPGIQATQVILRRLRQWQKFLQKIQKDLLSEISIKGLIGELLFITRHLFPAFGAGAAIQFWQGPEDAPQDFNIHDCAVEVKCQTGNTSPRVHISSIDQLCPQLPKMYLYVVTLGRVEDNNFNAVNLPALIQTIREKLEIDSPMDLERFNNLIYQEGYLDLEEYEHFNYMLVSERMYLVSDGFPRVCQEELPLGVVGINYDINLINCEPFAAFPKWVNL